MFNTGVAWKLIASKHTLWANLFRYFFPILNLILSELTYEVRVTRKKIGTYFLFLTRKRHPKKRLQVGIGVPPVSMLGLNLSAWVLQFLANIGMTCSFQFSKERERERKMSGRKIW